MTSKIVSPKDKDELTSQKKIVKTWLTGKCSCTLIIPLELARSCKMEQPGHVIVERLKDGLYIRKLEV
jgi:hypothetical protein